MIYPISFQMASGVNGPTFHLALSPVDGACRIEPGSATHLRHNSMAVIVLEAQQILFHATSLFVQLVMHVILSLNSTRLPRA